MVSFRQYIGFGGGEESVCLCERVSMLMFHLVYDRHDGPASAASFLIHSRTNSMVCAGWIGTVSIFPFPFDWLVVSHTLTLSLHPSKLIIVPSNDKFYGINLVSLPPSLPPPLSLADESKKELRLLARIRLSGILWMERQDGGREGGRGRGWCAMLFLWAQN